MRTFRTLLSPRATLLSPHPMEKTLIAPQVMMSIVHNCQTCHEPYYAPVPQVDRGHQGYLGAGDRLECLCCIPSHFKFQGEGQRMYRLFYYQLQQCEICIVIQYF